MEIFKGDQLIRTYTNQKPADFKSWPGGPSKPELLPAAKGLNRFTWDFRRESLPAVNGVFVYGDYNGTRVGPGAYSVRLTVNETEITKGFNILSRPGLQVTAADYTEQQQAAEQIEGAIRDMHEAVNQIRAVRGQITSYAALLKDNEEAKPLLEKGEEILNHIKSWEEELIQPSQKTFQDVINFNNQLNAELMYLKSYVDTSLPQLTAGARERLKDLLAQWAKFAEQRDDLVNGELDAYNKLYRELDLPALIME
jgi:hypothetical protein